MEEKVTGVIYEEVLERLEEFFVYKGVHSNKERGKLMGYKSPLNLEMIKSYKVHVGCDKLINLLNHYHDLNVHWLFSGQGKMLYGFDLKQLNLSSPKDALSLVNAALAQAYKEGVNSTLSQAEKELKAIIAENQKSKES